MFSRLLCTGVKSCWLNQTLQPRYFSQTIVSFKPTLTRSLRFTRDSPLNPVSKIRYSNLSVCKHDGAILTKGNPNTFAPIRRKETSSLDVNTDVLNNVFLYKYDRPNYFKYLNGFAVFQLLFWMGISYVVWKQLPYFDSQQGSLKKYVFDNFIGILTTTLGVLVGIGSALVIFAFTARSVRFLILNKGGQNVTMVTYHPRNSGVITKVPIDEIKCNSTRKEMKNYLPLKLQGRWFFYILDANGEFVNPVLFDHTVGALRK